MADHQQTETPEASPAPNSTEAAPRIDSAAVRARDPQLFDRLAGEYVMGKLVHADLSPRLVRALREGVNGEVGGKEYYAEVIAKAIAEAEDRMERDLEAIVDGGWTSLDDCIPAGTLLDEIDKAFIDTSDIPRELPFFAAIHYVSALLLQRMATLDTGGAAIRPDLWALALAPSGSGKSFSLNQVGKALGDEVDMFPGGDSSVKFLDNLSKHNRGLYAADEFAQFLMKIEKMPGMMAIKGYLLQCEQGSTISHGTMSTGIAVNDPALTIFGANVIETMPKYLTREMIVDGFGQRFAYIFAERDPARRPIANYTFEKKRAPAITAIWGKIKADVGDRVQFRMSPMTEAAYQRAFELVLKRAAQAGVPDGYSRRLSMRGQKYALVYHVLLGKKTDYIDGEDLGFAMRLVCLHLRDTARLLSMYGPLKPILPIPVFRERQLEQVEAYLRRQRDENKEAVNARKLQANVKIVKDADLARALMREAVGNDPTLASVVDLSPPKAGAAVRRPASTATPAPSVKDT